MNLSKIVEIVNAFDKANAGCSYGEAHTSNLDSVVALLNVEDKKEIKKLANAMHKKRRQEALDKLSELGINVDDKNNPYKYRFESRHGYFDE